MGYFVHVGRNVPTVGLLKEPMHKMAACKDVYFPVTEDKRGNKVLVKFPPVGTFEATAGRTP